MYPSGSLANLSKTYTPPGNIFFYKKRIIRREAGATPKLIGGPILTDVDT